MRKIPKAIFYVLRSGCAWRLLSHDLPSWQTVYHYCRLWRLQGLWEPIHSALREAVRVQAGREPQPRAAIMDRQSVKITGVGASGAMTGPRS